MLRTLAIVTFLAISAQAPAQKIAWPTGLDSATRQFYDLTFSLIEKFNDGKFSEVEADVKTLKRLVPNYTLDWNYANALHKISISEGRLFLKQGNIGMAAESLIQAGEAIQHNPSPHLKTFGPNMSLAKELLEAGELESVLRYFKLCKKIWTNPLINQWEDEVINGKIPEFKANLFY